MSARSERSLPARQGELRPLLLVDAVELEEELELELEPPPPPRSTLEVEDEAALELVDSVELELELELDSELEVESTDEVSLEELLILLDAPELGALDWEDDELPGARLTLDEELWSLPDDEVPVPAPPALELVDVEPLDDD